MFPSLFNSLGSTMLSFWDSPQLSRWIKRCFCCIFELVPVRGCLSIRHRSYKTIKWLLSNCIKGVVHGSAHLQCHSKELRHSLGSHFTLQRMLWCRSTAHFPFLLGSRLIQPWKMPNTCAILWLTFFWDVLMHIYLLYLFYMPIKLQVPSTLHHFNTRNIN